MKNEPNKAMEPTPVNVTIPANAGLAPFTSVAHLGRSHKNMKTPNTISYLCVALFTLSSCDTLSHQSGVHLQDNQKKGYFINDRDDAINDELHDAQGRGRFSIETH